jgi:hypothetical protein
MLLASSGLRSCSCRLPTRHALHDANRPSSGPLNPLKLLVALLVGDCARGLTCFGIGV